VFPDLLPFTQPQSVSWRARLLYRNGIRRSIRRKAVLICISKQTQAALGDVFPDHGCETRIIKPALSPRLISLARRQLSADVPLQVRGSLHAVSTPGPYLLAVGTRGPRKNTELLVSQHRRLVLEGNYSGSLILAGGDGKFHTAPREQRLAFDTVQPMPQNAHTHPPAVYDIGHVSDSDLSQLYAHADLLVNLSTEEGFGYPVLESLAHGTPAFVTENSPMVDIAQGGVIGTSLDPETCYTRMVSTLNSLPLLRQEAAAMPVDEFSIERLGRELCLAIRGEQPAEGVETTGAQSTS
jgi:glycosyltransferase involved in cell wall biosynthesis